MSANIRILIKKNILLEQRAWKWTLFEIVIIIVFYSVIVVNPAIKSKNFYLEPGDAQSTQLYEGRSSLYDMLAFLRIKGLPVKRLRYGLIYAPKNPITTSIVLATQNALKLHDIEGFKDEKTLLSHFNSDEHLAGIVFQPFETKENSLVPKKLNVAITFPREFRTIHHPRTHQRLWLSRCTGVLKEEDTDNLKHADLYLREGFLQIQHRLFMEWLRLLDDPAYINITNETILLDETMGGKLPTIEIKSFKQKTLHEPCYAESTSNIVWFLYYFTFFVPFLGVIRKFSRDHEENITTHHWIYGYEMGHHRIAHFTISLLHFIFLSIFICVFVLIEWSPVEKYNILRSISVLTFALFLLLYIITLIVNAMIVAALFANSKNSMLFAAAIWLGCYGLFAVVMDSTRNVTLPILLSIGVFFNNFYPYGMKIMKGFDAEPDYENIWFLFKAQFGYIFVYLFILSVVDFCRPGRYKSRRYFNFLFTPFCCNLIKKHDDIPAPLASASVAMDRPSMHNAEYAPPTGGQEYLYIRSVVTFWGKPELKYQLRKVSFRVFKNEISAIVAPHYSGKTRLITLMAGLSHPYKGDIIYNGQYDTYANWYGYRKHIDVSMQNNPLYDLFTVQETLFYFCELKMAVYDMDLITTEVEKWYNLIKAFMPKDETTLVRYLTYSQQRLLALCCTLACNRRIILLDDPTAHMAVAEQRAYWSILKREKYNRAIIMTTISIDEAEAVADRITILNDGKVLASGSPFFLKTQFGYGFDLIILKDPKTPSAPITDLINLFIGNIIPENQIGDQLIYKLPRDQRKFYQRMLIHLEKQSGELGIKQIRLRGSGLGEIYMTLGIQNSENTEQILNAPPPIRFVKQPPEFLKQQHKQAMLFKKMVYQASNVLPIFLIVGAFILIFSINQLSKHLCCKSDIKEGMNLGFPLNSTSRKHLDRLPVCKYTEIIETKTAKYNNKLNSRSLNVLFKNFKCGENPYSEDLMEDNGIFNKQGAIEVAEEDKRLILWINERVLHSGPLALNLAHNMLLKKFYPNDVEVITTITNKPMVIPLHVDVNLNENQIAHMHLSLILGIIMPITMSCFLVSLIEERKSHLLTLQRLAGVPPEIHWFVGILWDFATFFIIIIIYFIALVVVALRPLAWTSKFVVFFLLNVYGFSSLCWEYFLFLFLPDCKYSGIFISIIIDFIFGFVAFVFYWDVMENNILYFFVSNFFPTFALLDGIGNIFTESRQQKYCRDRCRLHSHCKPEILCKVIPDCCHVGFFQWPSPGILPSVVFMSISAIVFSIGFFCTNLYNIEKLYCLAPRAKQLGSVCFPSDDEDVVKEKIRIANITMRECRAYEIVADQVEKRIPKHGRAMNTVSFALERYKCMAIYGGHHSGKTHLLKQLIGEERINFGEVYIHSKDIKYQTSDAVYNLGYSPQNGGFLDAFTPRQLFTLLLMIQGVPRPKASQKLQELSWDLGLRRHLTKHIYLLPPKVKRHISIALALIIDNKVLILDEPTKGTRAADRRQICNLLRHERFYGNTIVFSSNDSLECEALSDFVAIFDQGEILAFGSVEYLTSKYTKGVYLELKLLVDGETRDEREENLESDVENMISFAKFLHGEATMVNQCENILKLYMPFENIKFSYLFGSLEKNQRRLNISEYTISLPSLADALDNILARRKLRDQYKTKKKYLAKFDDPSNKPDGFDPPPGPERRRDKFVRTFEETFQNTKNLQEQKSQQLSSPLKKPNSNSNIQDTEKNRSRTLHYQN